MAQVGGIVALQEPITDGKGDFFFAGVTDVKWRRPVVPGDTLVMEMELTAFKVSCPQPAPCASPGREAPNPRGVQLHAWGEPCVLAAHVCGVQ